MIDVELIFEDLKSQANKQQARSLSILNEVLQLHHKAGGVNFSVAEVARLSIARGGPSASTIRNKTGFRFRQLIEAWARKTSLENPGASKKGIKAIANGKDHDLLVLVSDPALRAIFGQIIAERNRYRSQLGTLKANSNIVIDKRSLLKPSQAISDSSVQVISSMSGLLNDMEVVALKEAISDEFFQRQGWTVSRAGQVKGEEGEIYKHGYVHAISKILENI